MADSSDSSDDRPTLQHPHIHRPVPRRALEPSILQDTADSPTHSFTYPAHSPTAADLQSSRSSDFLAQLNARLLRTYHAREDVPESPVDGTSTRLPRQNKSFLNMNSSTLFGIYDDVGASTHGVASVADTPWGTGAETPGHTGMGWSGAVYDSAAEGGISMVKSAPRVRGASTSGNGRERGNERGSAKAKTRGDGTRRPRSSTARYTVLAAKLVALFTFGVFYGTIVSHLHDTRHLAAVHVTGVDRKSWFYVTTWGCAGVALGSLLPYVDLLWRRHSLVEAHSTDSSAVQDKDSHVDVDADAEVPVSEQINDVVRSVAAFVGVAFAIRRLPWQSTLQLTLTLALVNPALWYILDRSKPGLSLSLLVTSLLTSVMFLSNPSALPSPQSGAAANGTAVGNGVGAGTGTGTGTGTGNGAGVGTGAAGGGASGAANGAASPGNQMFAGVISYDNLAMVTWVGSVLFCSCVCFGSIGRRLGVLEK